MRAPPNQTNIMHITYSVPSVESLKLLTIIEAEMDQNGKRSNCVFIKLSAISGLESQIYIVCNRKIDSFGNE